MAESLSQSESSSQVRQGGLIPAGGIGMTHIKVAAASCEMSVYIEGSGSVLAVIADVVSSEFMISAGSWQTGMKCIWYSI